MSPFVRHVQIGSFAARAFFESDADAIALNELFKGTVRETSNADAPIDAEIYWRHLGSERPAGAAPPDGLCVTPLNGHAWRIESEALTAHLELGAPHPQITIYSYPHAMPELAWRVHLSTVFHKLLFLLGRIYLHAGATQIEDAAVAFVGDKGSGKSTICLMLGRAGACVLSDDHVAIRQLDGRFLASGCEQVARITAATEAALLPQPLPVEARDFGGLLKKEFTVSDRFPSLPYQDVPLRRMFFTHIGERWKIRGLSPRHVTARLLEATSSSHRFAGKDDYARHLVYFSALGQAVEGFDAELSPDLTELIHLRAFLGV